MYVQEEFLGEESMGENMWVKSICKRSFWVKSLWVKSIWVKSMCKKSFWVKSLCNKSFWVKSLWVKSIGEHRDRWDAGFRSPLLRYVCIYIFERCILEDRTKKRNGWGRALPPFRPRLVDGVSG